VLSLTRQALVEFDNQHEFERLAADVLNALGYEGVEPMAPRGGADGGRDIKFREGETPGVALVTLDKGIRQKFALDLDKQKGEGVLCLFCNVDVTPALKLQFSRDALAKGFRLEVLDLERLRSLLDTSLKDIRRRYLGIDDAASLALRREVSRLLRFPDAVADSSSNATMLEAMLVDSRPRRLFEALIEHDEAAVAEAPEVGPQLAAHVDKYYRFRTDCIAVEEALLERIGEIVGVRFSAGWRIYLRYVLLRFAGMSKADVEKGGDFLNYSITWESAEKCFGVLSSEPELSTRVDALLRAHCRLGEDVDTISTDLGVP
jgi:hypothetical protein